MRRRLMVQMAAMTRPVLDIPPEVQEEAARKLAADECPQCGKTGLKNVGAHRRFCKG